ncbi:hypothetical protein BD324DRAFT_615077 [Kockovaella imperatae]|uniref:RmlD-like substrate binding domain-containing protein n=1 Tax=Kockovaella imperatae TaxID=4999 RepID=A0A1Y1UP41_9TREE|nr:hypothetical protein BD324DRAFT_615077 [Kockovaella imperatae]ORX39810.1 hypothetical protein BD324DRAFT_615077 [Kockovaella imperatae]
MKVAVTGASGLLGRAVFQYFEQQGADVIRLAYSRASDGYTKLDLLDQKAVEDFFNGHQVDVVVHCAAERRPDVVEADPAKAEQTNVAVPRQLAQLASKQGFRLFYISTDYVFNGTKPPYEVNDEPDPLQSYGQQKRAGEVAVLAERESGAQSTVLRVPILYGKTTYNAESAVNIIVDVVLDQSGKEYKMDDRQVRFPTNVEDIARVLYDLSKLDKSLPPILHYASPAPALTKYNMTEIIGKHLGVSIDHVKADKEKPVVKPGQTQRPENTQLSTKALVDIGIDTREDKSFDDWWKAYAGELKAKQ